MRACCSGVAPVLLTLWGGRAAQQNRDLLLRAQRALKEGVVIRKRQGEPFWFPLLLCARRPRRPHSPREARAHTLPLQPKRPNQARNACPYGLRPSDGVLPCLPQTKRGEPHQFPLLLCARRPRRPHFPVKRGHIRCPFSRNAPIGRAMRALRDASSKQHASRKPKKRRTPSGSPLFYLPLTYSM